MEMRKLGHHGPLVSKIGVGGVAMSDLYGHDRNDEESLATLHAAIDAGVTLLIFRLLPILRHIFSSLFPRR